MPTRLPGAPSRTIARDLIDEYRLLTYPVVLGTGKRLFPDGSKPSALSLIDHKTTSTCVDIDVYTPAGEPTYGSFELDEQQQITERSA